MRKIETILNNLAIIEKVLIVVMGILIVLFFGINYYTPDDFEFVILSGYELSALLLILILIFLFHFGVHIFKKRYIKLHKLDKTSEKIIENVYTIDDKLQEIEQLTSDPVIKQLTRMANVDITEIYTKVRTKSVLEEGSNEDD